MVQSAGLGEHHPGGDGAGRRPGSSQADSRRQPFEFHQVWVSVGSADHACVTTTRSKAAAAARIGAALAARKRGELLGLRPCFVVAGGQVCRCPVSDLPKRNGWTIAQRAGDRSPLRTQRLLSSGELAFHYCFVPAGQPVSKARLIRAAGLRWPVEEAFEFGKDCFGLDQPKCACMPRSPAIPCWSWLH
jgi:hypothetical protein